MIRLVDAHGQSLTLAGPARRVVSLVPSITETAIHLGAGDCLVGRTSYCIHPHGLVDRIPAVGGTKDPDLARIRELKPDLILANREENLRVHVEALQRDFPVHVSYPCDVQSLLQFIADLGTLLGVEKAASDLASQLREKREAKAGVPRAPLRVAYFIWRDPWMVAASDTFIDAMLTEVGFTNVLSGRATRYPKVDLARLADLGVDAWLLSSEPYAFTGLDADDLALQVGVPRNRVQLVSGEAFSWFGVRTLTVFEEAERIRAALSTTA